MTENNEEYDLAEVIIADELKRQVEHYGIDGLEEAIKRVYRNMPKAKEEILKVFYKMYRK